MLRAVVAAVAVAATATISTPASAAPAAPIYGAGASSAIPGKYIVVLKDTAAVRKAGLSARARSLAGRHQARVASLYERTLHGFSAAMSESQARALATDPDVEYIEQDQRISLASTQDNPPSWGLDRIDQPSLPLDTAYSYDPAPSGVTAYVLDSGVRITHPDFGGRASYGWDVTAKTATADDCYGHGTHVAGTLGGTTFGVAKNVKIVSVRVFDCQGMASETAFADGVEWVTMHGLRPAVVNLSWDWKCVDGGGSPTACPAGSAMNVSRAITSSMTAGFTYVIAAGNSNIDGCGDPLDQVPGTIVVGSADQSDAKAGSSNFGSCLTLFAPGVGINSTFFPGSVMQPACGTTCVVSGTSMAAPHVAGAIANLLSGPRWATATPSEVKAELLSHMVVAGKITGLDPASPNRLLNVTPPPAGNGSSIGVARNQGGKLNLYGVTKDGTLLARTQNASNATTDWSGWAPAAATGWYSVSAQQNGAGLINLRALTRNPQSIWDRSQQTAEPPTWLAWHQINGLLSASATALNSNGKLEWFGVNAGGQVFTSTDGAAGPSPLTALPFGGRARAVTAERNADGAVELFVIDSGGLISHAWETAPSSSTFTPWVALDGTMRSIAAARNADGLVELFATDAAGKAYHRSAVLGTNRWLEWTPFAQPAAVGQLFSVAAETNADGRVEAFAVNASGQVWHSWQDSAGALTYSAWTVLDGAPVRP